MGSLAWRSHTGAAKITRINVDLCFPGVDAKERASLARRSLAETGRLIAEYRYFSRAPETGWRQCVDAHKLDGLGGGDCPEGAVMCRMVGVVFRSEFPMETLRDLRDVARTGIIPGEPLPGHRDGWGIVSFRNGSPLYVGRSSRPIASDESFESALRDVPKIEPPNILMAHARAMSSGGATIPNTHPFIIDGIALCHNGTVRNIRFKPKHAVKGESDTEVLLARLVDRIDENGDLTQSIKDLISVDIHSHEYSAAIMFISDGKRFYAYRDFGPGKSAEYYDLKMAVHDDYVAFFQETRMGYDGEVSQLEDKELVIVDIDLNVRRQIMR